MERRYASKSAIDSSPDYTKREDFEGDWDGRPQPKGRFYVASFIIGFVVLLGFVFFGSPSSGSKGLQSSSGKSEQPVTDASSLTASSSSSSLVPAALSDNIKKFMPDFQMPLKIAPFSMTKALVPVPTIPNLKQMALLNKKCLALIKDARDLKWSGAVMETDERALQIISHLQDELRRLLTMRFGENPTILVEMILTFPPSMPDFAENGAEGRIVIEMAPIALVPYSVYNFLEIVRRFQKGAFHRNAGHVLQAMTTMTKIANPTTDTDKTTSFTMAFQEYHPQYPHKLFTLGYAGRPGGPAFYISTMDNTDNHGPASQGSKTEADSCFGRLHDSASEAVARRMQKQPGKEKKGAGFISDSKNFIMIKSMRIIQPIDTGADIATVNLDKE